jgi:hypothetical protein
LSVVFAANPFCADSHTANRSNTVCISGFSSIGLVSVVGFELRRGGLRPLFGTQ